MKYHSGSSEGSRETLQANPSQRQLSKMESKSDTEPQKKSLQKLDQKSMQSQSYQSQSSLRISERVYGLTNYSEPTSQISEPEAIGQLPTLETLLTQPHVPNKNIQIEIENLAADADADSDPSPTKSQIPSTYPPLTHPSPLTLPYTPLTLIHIDTPIPISLGSMKKFDSQSEGSPLLSHNLNVSEGKRLGMSTTQRGDAYGFDRHIGHSLVNSMIVGSHGSIGG